VGVGFMIIDSAGLACGGEPEKAEGAIRFFNALNSLGLSSLTTAHVTKEETKELYPFGSIFWHNGARMTWNVQGDRDLDVLHLGFFCRKANTLRERPDSFGLAIDGGHIRREPIRDYFGDLLPHRDQIRTVLLRQGGKTYKQLQHETGMSIDAVKKAVQRMDDVGKVGGTYHEPISGIVTDRGVSR
jgi:hypothetical protein